MPNYLYKCEICEADTILNLPLSSDSSKKYPCIFADSAANSCPGEMTRRIFPVQSGFIMKRGTLGEWYKRETGKELLGGS